jgi:hypothetical protein
MRTAMRKEGGVGIPKYSSEADWRNNPFLLGEVIPSATVL